ncbi:MAG TPA: right-handed parallel beta-helix repeat-containing protein [Candidatus Limnocylindrales bacterium]|nr:right-handed parallel beta-helix repeat-containing protein [Candidatus Limnocylindrales bacterium]
MRFRIYAAIWLSLCLGATTAGATDYYVSPGGSDLSSGLAPAAAWATLQHAADTIGPGDTVHVADGSYSGFDVRIVATAAQPVAFVADNPGGAVIVADNPQTPDGINVENAAYITIDGFDSSHRTRAGIRAAVSHHITVRNCTTGNNGVWGIFTGHVDDLLVENNETFGSVDEHGIYVSNSGDRPVIRGNHSRDNRANGIHMNGDESQGGDGLISNALVEMNVIHGNGIGGGSGINCDGVTDSVIRNNLLYDNHASGISLYRIDAAAGSSDNLVVNNTIYHDTPSTRWAINISGGSTGNTVRNNILYTTHSFRGVITIDPSSRPGFSSDYNSVRSRFSIDGGNSVIDLVAWQGEGYDLNSFVATPAQHFFDPEGDFRLLPSSPAIDAGTASGAPSTDIDDNPRPVGDGYDIGAYEVQLPDCGDGDSDAGEVCGEPTLPECADPCTTCVGCTCAQLDPVCGDMLTCGDEECESDGDCGGGEICSGCQCVNAPVCASAILLEGARQKLRSNPFAIVLKGEAVIPRPWIAVDPDAGGVRVVVDSTMGSFGFDAALPGGAAWSSNATGTIWKYYDPTGAVSGITRVVIKDRSSVEDGRLRFTIKGKGGVIVLPPADSVRTSIVFGTTEECASIAWGGPDEDPPACNGDAGALSCR